jgi:hypothetical protein
VAYKKTVTVRPSITIVKGPKVNLDDSLEKPQTLKNTKASFPTLASEPDSISSDVIKNSDQTRRKKNERVKNLSSIKPSNNKK